VLGALGALGADARVALVEVVGLRDALAPAVAVVLPLLTINNPHFFYFLYSLRKYH